MFVPSPVALKATTTKSFGFVEESELLSDEQLVIPNVARINRDRIVFFMLIVFNIYNKILETSIFEVVILLSGFL